MIPKNPATGYAHYHGHSVYDSLTISGYVGKAYARLKHGLQISKHGDFSPNPCPIYYFAGNDLTDLIEYIPEPK